MKRISVLGVCLMMAASVFAQVPQPQVITAMNLYVTYNKTSNLLFPYVIKSVDRGSRDLLAQKAKGVENILQVKAGKADFPETNLSIVTADGKLYAFNVLYAEKPGELNWLFPKDKAPQAGPVLFPDSVHSSVLEENAAWVSDQPGMFKRLTDHSFGIQVRLKGLYIDHDVFYYQLELRNTTHINYSPDLLRLFIKDRRQSKRTASQELLQEPLLIYGNAAMIAANSTQTIVVALPKFTIPDKKQLVVQVMERHGGRHLQLKLGNKTIVKACPILNE